MGKLLQYLKPFAGAIAAAVALVFLQAMCDLKLPDYMSDMVNVGIQQGGITDPVPEQTSSETMDKLLLFFTEEEEALLNQDYRQEGSLWTRTGKLSAPDRETLSAAFTRAFAAVGSIETLSKDPDSLKALLAQFPAAPENAAGAEAALSGDLFSLLKAMPREQRLEIAAKVAEQYDSAGENMSGQAAVAFLKAEYEALGVDTAAIQRSYILKTGLKMLAVALLAAACTVTVCFLSARVGTGLGRDLRSAVYGRVTDFSNAEFDKFSTSSLITRTTNDISQVQMLVVMAIRMMAYAPVMGVGRLNPGARVRVSPTPPDPKKPHNYGLFRGCAVSFCFCKNLRKNPQKSGNVILLLTLLLTQIFGADGVHGVEHRRCIHMDISLGGRKFCMAHHLLDHRRGDVPQCQSGSRGVPAGVRRDLPAGATQHDPFKLLVEHIPANIDQLLAF